MCDGEIVAPNPELRQQEIKKGRSFWKLLKDFFCRIKDYSIDSYRITEADYLELPKVNMCLKCGDLEIDDRWLRIPHPQKSSISEEIKLGGIKINGCLSICDFCVSMEKEIEEKRKNFYLDSRDIVPVSPMSF